MKKKILTALILAAAIVLTACGNSETDTEQTSPDNSAIQSELESLKAENEALMLEMSDMQTTVIKEEKTTVEKVVVDKASKSGIWEINYYIDDFGRQTDNCYIYGETQGTFSNMAASNDELDAVFLVDRYLDDNGEVYDSIAIELYEYRYSEVKNFFSEVCYYDIQVLEENDNIIYEEGYMLSRKDRIYVLGDTDCNSIINAMKNNDTLTFRIDEQDGFSSYIFDVDCTGFKELFESIDWNV